MVHNQLCVVGDPEVIRPAIAELMFAYLARSKALSLGFPLNEARSKSLTEVFGWMWLLPLSAETRKKRGLSQLRIGCLLRPWLPRRQRRAPFFVQNMVSTWRRRQAAR